MQVERNEKSGSEQKCVVLRTSVDLFMVQRNAELVPNHQAQSCPMSQAARVSIVFSQAGAMRFDVHCKTECFKKSLLIVNPIREHLERKKTSACWGGKRPGQRQ